MCILKELSHPHPFSQKKKSIAVLLWTDILAAYAVWVMMTNLTNVWRLNLTHAAAIVNMFTGAATIMPIVMAFHVNSFMGDSWMLLLSSLAYSFVGFQNFLHLFMCFYYATNIGLSCLSLLFILPCQTSYNTGATT